ncbi:MAG: zeta toxin family protein [Candidatus Cardinium sp.]|uniref:zeta toxin family protein n=1 Tax=Cardinium endosymbiont of Dermatophagoides farinae TaxID=2597823 RepID=UPI001182D953|nr:zeta toxin family protein [Cardinium endosymbiont of Dermatophagoides farinae]TSJ80901.1 zeta toxin [Cardinium endosymbiont of Dermatophagoides farinae]UWW96913.1 MAG: zeta toxin family protein [Candidatus Cardinium sp.]
MINHLYIISGPNGAGKTTASFTILPDILDCKEFVNANQIAFGLSPFDPDKVSMQAGKLMIARINELMEKEVNFALETTLASRSYVSFIKRAKNKDYVISLYYFWLSSVDIAKERVQKRIANGGYNIPVETIERRYNRSIVNLVTLYLPICDNWIILNSQNSNSEVIAYKKMAKKEQILNKDAWESILKQSKQ